ncbi:Cathepsin_B [Hexamita inflata]|uniref:Cathepsin B n=1 Tax=Hexamita inflata TaxID=28002 RepID=A0AA86V1U7_9EUKA|nr:Cathepsin B [Hexamita inflata]
MNPSSITLNKAGISAMPLQLFFRLQYSKSFIKIIYSNLNLKISSGSFSDNRCIKYFTDTVYSEQYMVSCDKNCHGCNSGYLSKNVAFLKSTGVTSCQVQYY